LIHKRTLVATENWYQLLQEISHAVAEVTLSIQKTKFVVMMFFRKGKAERYHRVAVTTISTRVTRCVATARFNRFLTRRLRDAVTREALIRMFKYVAITKCSSEKRIAMTHAAAEIIHTTRIKMYVAQILYNQNTKKEHNAVVTKVSILRRCCVVMVLCKSLERKVL
jgi:hypothetical protein